VGARLRAITFDLWDTIVRDDSDEPKRRARGLRSKRDERRHLVWEALHRLESLERFAVDLAYDTADAAFNTVWHEQHVTWPIETRLRVVLAGLKRQLPPKELAEVVRAHERMEVEIPPELVPGCREALESLSRNYRLAIVSDAIVTPGRCLRDLLAGHGVVQYFQGFAFSDEVGRSKPDRTMFEFAAKQLGVQSLDEMLHVGDRDHNDVKGPQSLGMKAILFTASRDVDRLVTSADAVCGNYQELPDIVDRLARQQAQS
jgi:putative hydrolase of the HAD superfamily